MKNNHVNFASGIEVSSFTFTFFFIFVLEQIRTRVSDTVPLNNITITCFRRYKESRELGDQRRVSRQWESVLYEDFLEDTIQEDFANTEGDFANPLRTKFLVAQNTAAEKLPEVGQKQNREVMFEILLIKFKIKGVKEEQTIQVQVPVGLCHAPIDTRLFH
jgi:hypothetical protein